MRISFILVFLIVYSLAFADMHVDSKAEVKIPVGQEQQSTITNTIQATVGKEFVIILDANATTGYEWQFVDPIVKNLINLVSSEYIPNKTALIGSGGKSVWTFKAIQVGKTQISFKYIRAWEKNIPPAKEATYIVNVQQEK